MSDMSVDTVLRRGSDADRDRQWRNEHPVWAHIGAFMERVAAFCGTHSAGYICPPFHKTTVYDNACLAAFLAASPL